MTSLSSKTSKFYVTGSRMPIAGLKCYLVTFTCSNTVIPRVTSASTYEIFEILAVDGTIFFFEIRETFEIRATGSPGRPAAHHPFSALRIFRETRNTQKKLLTGRASELFNNTCLTHFHNILKGRKNKPS